MGNGTRLALAIMILFLAMVAFFFAFHPQGVENVTDGPSALQWLMGEFDETSSGTAASTTQTNSGATPAQTTTPTLTPQTSQSLTNTSTNTLPGL